MSRSSQTTHHGAIALIKYPVRNERLRGYLCQLLPGRRQKVIKKGNSGEVHYVEHQVRPGR